MCSSRTTPAKAGAHRSGKLEVLRLFPRQQPYGTLYVGTTSDFMRRVWEHGNQVVPGFTKKYTVDHLVWFEAHETAESALRREKQIKEWKRDWKINLVERAKTDIGSIYIRL